MATPEYFTDYDDGPGDPIWGYDWRAHLVADTAALVVAAGSIAALAWLTLIGGPPLF